MSEFTKGPWSKGWGEGLTGPTTPNGDGPTVAGRKAYFVPVFTGMKTLAIAVGTSNEEIEANAALIAAAPELYEALRLFVAYDDSASDNSHAVLAMLAYNDAITAARAALAKASQ